MIAFEPHLVLVARLGLDDAVKLRMKELSQTLKNGNFGRRNRTTTAYVAVVP